MQSPTFYELVRPMERFQRILQLGFIAAIALYILMAYVLFGWPASNLSNWDPLLKNPVTVPLAVISFLTAVASLWVPGLLLPDRQLRELSGRKPDPEALARNPRTGRVDADRLAKLKVLQPMEQRLLSLPGLSFTPFLVRLALNESIALYGFVLSILSKTLLPVIPFAVVAIGLQLTVSPKLDSQFERAARLGVY
jgi:hypothetical protein